MDNEVFLRGFPQDNQNDKRLEKILLLQRQIRSYYVRRQFQQVRNEYLKTISEIEGDAVIKSVEITPKKEEPPPPPPTTTTASSQKQVAIIPTKEELLRKREEIAIELMWIEQAIQSRKDYLRLKSRYTTCTS